MEMTGLKPFFSAITAERDVTRGKPDPEVFQKAAAKIHCHPADCVVFEDALVGIQAALAAGSKAVAVGTTHSLDKFPEAHAKVHRLTEVSVSKLKALWCA
jgi:beta-phosphoglucomutase